MPSRSRCQPHAVDLHNLWPGLEASIMLYNYDKGVRYVYTPQVTTRSKIVCGDEPPFVQDMRLELAGGEPPRFASQWKQRGRKPKNKRPEELEAEDAAGAGAKRCVSKAKKIRRSDRTEATSAKMSASSQAEGNTSSSSRPKKVRSKKAKKGGKQVVNPKASPMKAAGKRRRKGRNGRAILAKAKAWQEPSESFATEPKAPRAKAKATPAAGKKPGAKRRAAPALEELPEVPAEVAAEPPIQHPLKMEPLPPDFVFPPDWVQSSNVYSNLYRRLQSQGLTKDEVRQEARKAAEDFRKHGGVHCDLLSSFGLFKGSKKTRSE